jgi:hypothetical protein
MPSPPARPASLYAGTAFLAALAVRFLLLVAFPDNIGLDGFQRWAGRDWLLVQGWLPGPQLLIWSAGQLGVGIFGTRVLMAVVASLAVAAGAVLAEAVGGRAAGWMFIAAGAFGPFTLWGSALYQEGLFLLVLFAGLALALRGRLTAGDALLGALGLVRYEAWPLLLLYVVWRRSPRALLVGWGPAVWLGGHLLGWEGHAASPIDYFSDWQGLAARFTVAGWLEDAERLLRYAWDTGALVFVGAAIVGLRDRAPASRLVAAMTGVQLLLVALWMVGLERATPRMLIVPTMLAAVVAVAALARRFEGPRMRRGIVVLLVVVAWISSVNTWRAAEVEARFTHHERIALTTMAAHPGVRWWITPRTGLGPRDRHDGCEILQGVSELRHGTDFRCAAWPDDAATVDACGGTVTWDGQVYVVTLGGPPPR